MLISTAHLKDWKKEKFPNICEHRVGYHKTSHNKTYEKATQTKTLLQKKNRYIWTEIFPGKLWKAILNSHIW